jgi:hypothetical protein
MQASQKIAFHACLDSLGLIYKEETKNLAYQLFSGGKTK